MLYRAKLSGNLMCVYVVCNGNPSPLHHVCATESQLCEKELVTQVCVRMVVHVHVCVCVCVCVRVCECVWEPQS